jgi:AcrR family transcriptional regulator
VPVGSRQTLGKSQEELRGETRELILASARELFENMGYAHTSMQMIASRARISRSSLYRHFETKKVIAQELTDLFWPGWREMWKDCPFHEGTTVAELAEWLHRLLAVLNTSKSFVYVAHAVEESESEAAVLLTLIGQNAPNFRPANKTKSEAYFFDHLFMMQLNKFFYSSILNTGYFRNTDTSVKAMAKHMKLFLDARKVYQSNDKKISSPATLPSIVRRRVRAKG